METKEFEKLLPFLYCGCSFEYQRLSGSRRVYINNDGTANFSNTYRDGNPSWPIQKLGIECAEYISDIRHPDGSPLLPIVLSKEEKIYNKCRKLWNSSKYVKKNPKAAY